MSFVWVTGDDVEVEVSAMSASHLRNALTLLESKLIPAAWDHVNDGYRASTMFQGDAATMEMDRAIEGAEEEHLTLCAARDAMLEELQKRGLAP